MTTKNNSIHGNLSHGRVIMERQVISVVEPRGNCNREILWSPESKLLGTIWNLIFVSFPPLGGRVYEGGRIRNKRHGPHPCTYEQH